MSEKRVLQDDVVVAPPTKKCDLCEKLRDPSCFIQKNNNCQKCRMIVRKYQKKSKKQMKEKKTRKKQFTYALIIKDDGTWSRPPSYPSVFRSPTTVVPKHVDEQKTCRRCKNTLSKDHFYYCHKSPTGLKNYCNFCYHFTKDGRCIYNPDKPDTPGTSGTVQPALP